MTKAVERKETEEERKEREKQAALEKLRSRDLGFQWTIGGATRARDTLIKEVESGSDLGSSIVREVQGLGFDPQNQLGRRYQCLVCGTHVLCTKAKEGVLSCCGQRMTSEEPKPLPSSD